MPEFIMCLNSQCPRRMACHRFTATPGAWQDYAKFRFTNESDFQCDAYMTEWGKDSD